MMKSGFGGTPPKRENRSTKSEVVRSKGEKLKRKAKLTALTSFLVFSFSYLAKVK